MTTGQRIKELRKAAKMSQDELAKRTGYTDRSSIAKIESGKTELSESKIKLFAEALNTMPAVIMGIQKPAAESDELAEKRKEVNALFDKCSPEDQDLAIDFLKRLSQRQ